MTVIRQPLKAEPINITPMNLAAELTNPDDPANQQPKHIQQIVTIAKDKRMVPDGPLARAVTEELMKVYARKVNAEMGMSLETQAMDTVIGTKIWAAHQETQEQGNRTGMLFAIQRDKSRLGDLLQFKNNLADMTQAQKAASAVIIEGDDSMALEGRANGHEAGIRQAAYHAGVPVFASLEEFLRGHGLR